MASVPTTLVVARTGSVGPYMGARGFHMEFTRFCVDFAVFSARLAGLCQGLAGFVGDFLWLSVFEAPWAVHQACSVLLELLMVYAEFGGQGRGALKGKWACKTTHASACVCIGWWIDKVGQDKIQNDKIR